MTEESGPAAPTERQDTKPEDATFLGWQKLKSGGVFPLYTITAAGNPSRGSTVTDSSLLKLNLEIPKTPVRPAKMI